MAERGNGRRNWFYYQALVTADGHAVTCDLKRPYNDAIVAVLYVFGEVSVKPLAKRFETLSS